ncbi:MAG: tetratricopeptide repeat protein [Vicingaceae bacterium]
MRKQRIGWLLRCYKKCFALILLLTIGVQASLAQQSLVFKESNPAFRNAIDLYQKEKFLPAQTYFEKSIEAINDVHSEVRIEAEYYYALCAVELFHANAEALLLKFIDDHPESQFITRAYFNLARFQFRKRKYEDVIKYLAKVDRLDLKSAEQAEYNFRKGYAHFQLEEFDEAATYFYEIKDTDNIYVSAARYYYGHIAYHQNNYQTAAENFNKIANDPQFGTLVPYYLTQIYYLQKKYELLLEYAPAVLDSAPPQREEEIRKLIGDAYFKTNQFEKALPNLEAYHQRNAGTKDDFYQLGYAYFKTNQFEQAIQNLKKAVGDNDTISQSAYYYIAEASIKTKNVRDAKSAFRNAYQLAIDPEITEDALFNYAKTAYELSYHPYDDAILAFEEYINDYPNSTKLNDAYEYLVAVYYTTKNYEEALKSIDRIKSKDIKLLQAKQRLAYYRGVELFNQGDHMEAVDRFNLSLMHNYEPTIKAMATFWLAESYYQLKDYDNADGYYSDFLASSGSRSIPYYKKAYYHLGYTYYERKKYSAAIFWFREYVDKADPANKGLITDALLRTGDSYFITKDYRNAVEYYDEAAKVGAFDQDYALLQSAISVGVLGDYEKKAKKLAHLIKTQDQSVYMDDAIFELGKTYLVMSKDGEALSYYNKLVNDYPKSEYVAAAYLKIGLIHYNRKEDDLALNAFDQVVKNYANSSVAKEALEKISKIFIDKGDAQAYQDYINGVPFANVSKSELDSTSYVIAENAYLSGNCEKATRDFTNYLNKYPKGIFALNAHYYRGDCEAKSNFDQEAVEDFKYVVNLKQNKFTEKALVSLGELYRNLQQTDNAIAIYERLRKEASRKSDIKMAEINLMKLHFEKADYESAATYAKQILEADFVEEKLWNQAKMTLAKTAFEKENYAEALSNLDSLSKKSNVYGAEAKFLQSKIYYLQGLIAKSDTAIYALVDQVPSFPYWIAKGFIQLADNFIARDDYYNARLTFQSVIDNADNKELIAIAKEKLRLLNELDNQDKTTEKAPPEVEIKTNNVKDQSIFEPEGADDKKEVKPMMEESDEK